MIYKKYTFKDKGDIDLNEATKDYLVTNWSLKLKSNKILISKKNVGLIKKISLGTNVYIDKIYVKHTTNTILLYCLETNAFFLIDIETEKISRIAIPKSLKIDSLLTLYYWQDNIFIVEYASNKFLVFDIYQSTFTPLEIENLSLFSLEFYNFAKQIAQIEKRAARITLYPASYQFSYYDAYDNKLIFVDTKNELKKSVSYTVDDIHDIYYIHNFFIVIYCDRVEKIYNEKDIEKLIKPAASSEFRGSIFDFTTNRLFVLSRYWRGITKRMTLYSLDF